MSPVHAPAALTLMYRRKHRPRRLRRRGARLKRTLLSAPACPAGCSTVILAGDPVAMQLHESVGHAVDSTAC